MDTTRPHCTPGLRLFQRIVAVDNRLRLHNRDRLLELNRNHGSEIELFSAHSAVEFDLLHARGHGSKSASAPFAQAPHA